MITVRRSLWDEPRPAGAPPVGRPDWLLVGLFGAAAVIEGIARPDLAWRPLVIVLALALLPALLWRRSRPLLAALIGWGVAALLSILQLTTNAGDLGLLSMMAVLILLYSLVRWGSGPEVVVGIAFVTVVVVLGMYAASAGWAEVLGATALLLMIVALAVVFRYRADLWERQQREIRNEERVALARELHDTVAHHVSAIAVQAQAGRVVAATRTNGALEALEVIEEEASRALEELRSMVGALRDDRTDLRPQQGIDDLSRLERHGGLSGPRVTVTIGGHLDGVRSSVDAACFRLAQEAVTNALRHARHASEVEVRVDGDDDNIHLTVVDDGRGAGTSTTTATGFGLIGMAERARLLGGTFEAGPRPDGGWAVTATLPRQAATT